MAKTLCTASIACALFASMAFAGAQPAHADDLTQDQLSLCMEVHLSATSLSWTGKALEPQVTSVTNWSLDEDLQLGTGYSVVGYSDNTNIGTGYVVLQSLTEGYQGTWRVPFKIETPAAESKIAKEYTSDGNTYRMLSDGSVALSKYTASKKTAKVDTVKFGGRTFEVSSIDAKAFKGAKATKVVLNTQVKAVSPKAFYKCASLKSVQVGQGVSKLGASAFKGAKKLKIITVKSNVLTRSGVKDCLRGSKVKTVKLKGVKAVKKRLYKRYFSKENCGRFVKVK